MLASLSQLQHHGHTPLSPLTCLSYLFNSPAGSGQAARKTSIPNSWALGNSVPVSPIQQAKFARPPRLASYLFWYILLLHRVSGAAAVAPCFKTHHFPPSDLLPTSDRGDNFAKFSVENSGAGRGM